MSSIRIPAPLIAGETIISDTTKTTVTAGRKTETTRKVSDTLYSRLSTAASIGILKDSVQVTQTIEQACLSIIANYWLDHAIPQGDDDAEVTKQAAKMMTDSLESLIWGNDHKAVKKPDTWRQIKSVVSRNIGQYQSHSCLFAAHDGDDSPDYDCVLSRRTLASQLSKTSTPDATKMSKALESFSDMSTETIQANADDVIAFVHQASSALGARIADAVGIHVNPVRDVMLDLRTALDDEQITPEQVIAMVTAWQAANAPKVAKVA